MTHGYKRFKREMVRAKENGIELVLLVEALLGEVADGYEHSSVKGESIVQKLFTLRERYGLETVFCKSREEACYYIMHRWMAAGRERINGYSTKCGSVPTKNGRLGPVASKVGRLRKADRLAPAVEEDGSIKHPPVDQRLGQNGKDLKA